MDKLSINLASYVTCVSILAFMLERFDLARFVVVNPRQRFGLRMSWFDGSLRMILMEIPNGRIKATKHQQVHIRSG